MTLTDVDGFLASQSTDETGCGSPRVPWIIKAKPGQVIEVTMMDFGVASNKHLNGHDCPVLYGYIVDKAADVNKTICGSDERQQHVYTSRSNVIQIVILPTHSRRGDSRFLLHYQSKRVCACVCVYVLACVLVCVHVNVLLRGLLTLTIGSIDNLLF